MTRAATLRFDVATPADAAALAALRSAVAAHLARAHGFRPWSWTSTEASIARLLARPQKIPNSRVLVARRGTEIVGTAHLVTKKPWAIDRSYFTRVPKALYLIDMAVAPDVQRRGVGRRLVDEVKAVARAWPAAAIRLDAYDDPSGAGGFYAKCGFTEVGRATYRNAPLIYFECLLGAAPARSE